jgi:hypothetical protein
VARWLVRAALPAVPAFAVVKRFVLAQPPPGTLKHNLSVDRVINFLAILCVTARLVRVGSVAWLAQHLPAVVRVGRTGLVCFVTGTPVALRVDTATPHAFHGVARMLVALSGDLVAIIAMLVIARGLSGWKAESLRAALNGAGCA